MLDAELGSEDRCSVQLSYGRLPYFRLIAATGTRAERPLRARGEQLARLRLTI
jgi:hypothetical protein